MSKLMKLLHRPAATNARFERYYANLVRTGAGHPTADEARQDLRRYERTFGSGGWLW